MKNLKVSEVAEVNALLKKATMVKGDVSAKLALVDAIIATKKIADDYNDFVSITREKLQPENFSQMQEQAARQDLTRQEIVEVNRFFLEYQSLVDKAINAKAQKIVEINLTPWTKEQFTTLLESNSDFTGGQFELLYSVLVGELV